MATRSAPARYNMTSNEVITFTWDMTNLLADGETASSPVVTVTRVTPTPETTVAAALSGSASVSSNVVTQTIDGTELTNDNVYRVSVVVDTSGGETLEMQTYIFVGDTGVPSGPLSNSLIDIRQAVGVTLSDMILVEAESGTDSSLTDTSNIVKPNGEFRGSYIYFYSGNASNNGKKRVINASDFGTSTINWNVSLPSAVASGDKAEIWNNNGTGWDPSRINDMIVMAHKYASAYNSVPINSVIASAFSSADSENYVDIGSDLAEVNGVQYLSSSGDYVEIPKARSTTGDGYWIDAAARKLYIVGGWRSRANTLTVRIVGMGREPALSIDSDYTQLNLEWLVKEVCYMACAAQMTNSPDANLLRDKANMYFQEAATMRALIIPTKPPTSKLVW